MLARTPYCTSIIPGVVKLVTGSWSYYLFDRESLVEQQIKVRDQGDEILEHGRSVRCAYCKTLISYQGNAEDIQGQHVHHFVNPGGYSFIIGCFCHAYCKVMGSAMLKWSWFSAYSWQYALCPQCHEHLGWFYHCVSDDSSFYGLIFDRLIIDSSAGDAE